jgi:hypothetical protein
MVLQPHNSKLTIELLKDFQTAQLWSCNHTTADPPKVPAGFSRYNYGLVTTQQRAHNRTPAGFSDNTVMVL